MRAPEAATDPAAQEALLDTGGMVFVSVYLLSLLAFGWWGRSARKEHSMEDFYLGGRVMGFGVLLLTLYATQYSGNTLMGFAGSAYRNGFSFLVAMTFMMAVIGGYLIYAPRLQRLSRTRMYITPSDYIQDRFGLRPLSVLVSVLGIIALCNYILTNLKAIGGLVEVSTGGSVSPAAAIIALSLIMVIYETLGGMRSVAWTDVVQGLVLFAGCMIIFGVIFFQFDGMAVLSAELKERRPEWWTPPEAAQMRTWFSTLLVVGLGISLYPHAIQRIYAARNARTLRRTLQVMAFLPIFTTFFMLVVGWVGAAKLDLAGPQTDRVTVHMLNLLATEIPQVKLLLVLFLSAVIAAIMSTIDSALLSISSMVTKDIYEPARPESSQRRLTRLGKIISWLLMAMMACLALLLNESIWALIQIKLELLLQLAPAFFLGLHWKNLKAMPVFVGLAVGTFFTVLYLVLVKSGLALPEKPWGMHAGLWGALLNVAVLLLWQALASSPEPWKKRKPLAI